MVFIHFSLPAIYPIQTQYNQSVNIGEKSAVHLLVSISPFEGPGDQPALYSLYICVSLGSEFQRFTGFGADKSAADNNYLFRHFILL